MYTEYPDLIEPDPIEYPTTLPTCPPHFHVLCCHLCLHLFSIPSPPYNLLNPISAAHVCVGVGHPVKYEQLVSSHTPKGK